MAIHANGFAIGAGRIENRVERWCRRSAWRRTLAGGAVLAALAALPATASAGTVTVQHVDVDRFVTDALAWGRVVSVPAGIDCPRVCSATFTDNTKVGLSAAGARGFTFDSWLLVSGVDPTECDDPPRCAVTVGAQESVVEARFRPAAKLTAVPSGAGTLGIAPGLPGRPANAICQLGDPPGSDQINADNISSRSRPACTRSYLPGTTVTVTAFPAPGARLVGWSDDRCSPASTVCKLTLGSDTDLTALFDPVLLTVQRGAYGTVSITPPSGSFSCTFMGDTPACQRVFKSGTLVTLGRQNAAPGQFWTGPCLGNKLGLLDADVCRVRVLGNQVVVAGFPNLIPAPAGSSITVSIAGSGGGSVAGSVIGGNRTLLCPSACSISGLTTNDSVSLSARASGASRFTGWSRSGSKSTATTVLLSEVQRITATFAKQANKTKPKTKTKTKTKKKKKKKKRSREVGVDGSARG